MKNLEDLMIAVSEYMYESIMLLDSVKGSNNLEHISEQSTLRGKIQILKEVFFDNDLNFDLLPVELKDKGFNVNMVRDKVYICVEIDCIVKGERFRHPVSMELDKVIDLFMNSKTED